MASYKTDFLCTLRWTGNFYLFFLEKWPKLRAKLIFQVFLAFFWKEEIYLIRALGQIQVLAKEVWWKGGPKGGFQVLGNAISTILRQSQHVLISFFFKVKVTFFLDKNITKLRKNDANTLHFNFFQLFLCFIKDRINKKHFSGVSFHKKLNQRIVVNRLYLVNVHHRWSLTVFRLSWSDGSLFACSLSAEVTGFIEQQRLNLVMNLLHLKLTVFILYFYKFLTSAVLI